MENELVWGLPVIGYLFLAGLGAGAMVTSATMLLIGEQKPAYFRFARYGAIFSIPTVAIGTLFLIFELGTFQAGYWFKWLHLFTTITMSPMSIGTWMLVLFFISAVPYAYTFVVPESHNKDNLASMRRRLALPNIVLGVAVAVYTGILLGAMPARPLWNSPLLALLFLVSALSTGVAAVLLSEWFSVKTGLSTWFAEKLGWDKNQIAEEHNDAAYKMATTGAVLIALEMLVLSLFFLYAHLSVGNSVRAIDVLEFGGAMSTLFWVGVVLLGLAIPIILEAQQVMPRFSGNGTYTHSGMMIVLVPVLVVVGGFILRYVIVVGGQIAKLAGI